MIGHSIVLINGTDMRLLQFKKCNRIVILPLIICSYLMHQMNAEAKRIQVQERGLLISITARGILGRTGVIDKRNCRTWCICQTQCLSCIRVNKEVLHHTFCVYTE